MVERAFSSDSVNEDTYQSTCLRLMAQFRTTEEALRRDGALRDLDTFVAEYQVDCPRALERLRVGVPATVLHATGSSGKSAHVHVADTVRGRTAATPQQPRHDLREAGRCNTSSQPWMPSSWSSEPRTKSSRSFPTS